MNRKHCVYCHKSSPIDAESCIRCGHRFAQSAAQSEAFDTEIMLANESSFPSRKSRPSIPPASPHQAGHHPGLHPEDQPYQSSVIKVQRPPKPTPVPIENIKLLLDSAPAPLMGALQEDEPGGLNAQHPVSQGHNGLASATTIFSTPVQQMSPDPITPMPTAILLPAWDAEEWQPNEPRIIRKPLMQRRTVPTLLTIA